MPRKAIPRVRLAQVGRSDGEAAKVLAVREASDRAIWARLRERFSGRLVEFGSRGHAHGHGEFGDEREAIH